MSSRDITDVHGEDTPLIASRVPSRQKDESQRDENPLLRPWVLALFYLVLSIAFMEAAWSIHLYPIIEPAAFLYPVVERGDFGPYLEYSVIHTDRSLNLMSDPFQQVMRNLNLLLKTTYNADKVVIIPGSGTHGMEAVARQFATNEHVMVIRNGYFSYRWSDIFEFGFDDSDSVEQGGRGRGIPSSHTVLRAQPVSNRSSGHQQYVPYAVDLVVQQIHRERPKVLFAPHVETSTGMILPDDYIRTVSRAIHDVGGLFVLDCIASGSVWIDMKALGVDVLISAPQKSWTAPPCAALVLLSKAADAVMQQRQETSFSVSLKRWSAVMDAYVNGTFAYHTTPPTDALRDLQQVSVEMLAFGLDRLKQAQLEMGSKARASMKSKGLVSVAAPGFEAPAVLVFYSPENVIDNPEMVELFHRQGLQIAMGIPWKLGEPENTKTFRIGLFGLDKLRHVDETVAILDVAVDQVLDETKE